MVPAAASASASAAAVAVTPPAAAAAAAAPAVLIMRQDCERGNRADGSSHPSWGGGWRGRGGLGAQCDNCLKFKP